MDGRYLVWKLKCLAYIFRTVSWGVGTSLCVIIWRGCCCGCIGAYVFYYGWIDGYLHFLVPAIYLYHVGPIDIWPFYHRYSAILRYHIYISKPSLCVGIWWAQMFIIPSVTIFLFVIRCPISIYWLIGCSSDCYILSTIYWWWLSCVCAHINYLQ